VPKFAGDYPAQQHISSVTVRSYISFFVDVSFIAAQVPHIGDSYSFDRDQGSDEQTRVFEVAS
jgi:hypothetical protein